MSDFKTTEELSDALRMHCGSVQTYHIPGKESVTYTEGFKDFLEKAQCYWLLTDFIASIIFMSWTSNQSYPAEVFVCSVVKEESGKTLISFLNGNLEALLTAEIKFSTFPLGKYEFFISGWNGRSDRMLCFLKSEY